MRFILILLINIIFQNNIFGEPFIQKMFDHLATNHDNHIKCTVSHPLVNDVCTLSAQSHHSFRFVIEYLSIKIIIDFTPELIQLSNHSRFYQFKILRSSIYKNDHLIIDKLIDLSHVFPEYTANSYTLIFPFTVSVMSNLEEDIKSKLFDGTHILFIKIPYKINKKFFDQITQEHTIRSDHVIISDPFYESSDDMHSWKIPEVKSYDVLEKIIDYIYHRDLCVETSEYCYKKNLEIVMRYVILFRESHPGVPAPYILTLYCKNEIPCLHYNSFEYLMHTVLLYKIEGDDTVYVLDNANPNKTWLTYSKLINEYSLSGELEYIRVKYYYNKGGQKIFII